MGVANEIMNDDRDVLKALAAGTGTLGGAPMPLK